MGSTFLSPPPARVVKIDVVVNGDVVVNIDVAASLLCVRSCCGSKLADAADIRMMGAVAQVFANQRKSMGAGGSPGGVPPGGALFFVVFLLCCFVVCFCYFVVVCCCGFDVFL